MSFGRLTTMLKYESFIARTTSGRDGNRLVVSPGSDTTSYTHGFSTEHARHLQFFHGCPDQLQCVPPTHRAVDAR